MNTTHCSLLAVAIDAENIVLPIVVIAFVLFWLWHQNISIRSFCLVVRADVKSNYTHTSWCVHVNIFHLQHKVTLPFLSTDINSTYFLSRKLLCHRNGKHSTTSTQHHTQWTTENCWLSVTPNPSVVLSAFLTVESEQRIWCCAHQFPDPSKTLDVKQTESVRVVWLWNGLVVNFSNEFEALNAR